MVCVIEQIDGVVPFRLAFWKYTILPPGKSPVRFEVSRRWLWRMETSGMLRRVNLVRTDVSEELSASIIRATIIGELGKSLAVTGNRHSLWRNAMIFSVIQRKIWDKCRNSCSGIDKNFISPSRPHRIFWSQSGRDVKLATPLWQVLRSIMSGYIDPLCNTSL
jgi:hypothetical protein